MPRNATRCEQLVGGLKERGYTVVRSEGCGGTYAMYILWRDVERLGTSVENQGQLDIKQADGKFRMSVASTGEIASMARKAFFTGAKIAGKVHIPSFEFDLDKFDLKNEVTIGFLCDQVDAMWLKPPVVSEDSVEGYTRIGEESRALDPKEEWTEVWLGAIDTDRWFDEV